MEKITYNGDSKVIKHICSVINDLIDSGGSSPSAADVSYDNTVSGLTATDVQDAIDEVVADIPTDFVSKASGGTFGGNVTVDRANGTISAVGNTSITIGNSTPEGTAGNSRGSIYLFGKGSAVTRILTNATANNNVYIPDASGTVAIDYEVAFDITSFKNGWTGIIRVTHNKYTKITSLSGILHGGSATSNIFADATTDGDNATKIPVPSQAAGIVPNQQITSYPITFGQVSGNNWQAGMNKAVGSVAICTVYVSAF